MGTYAHLADNQRIFSFRSSGSSDQRVLVFKTSVNNRFEAERLRPILNELLGSPDERWNFDLEDCDRILRIVSPRLVPHLLISLLELNGFMCKEL